MRLAVFGKRDPQRLFGPGFADRAGDADDLGVATAARRGGEVAQAGEHFRHDQKGCVVRKLRAPVGGDDCERGLGRQRRRDEVMAVAMLAVNGEKGLARQQRAAVDGQAGNRLRQRAVTLGTHRRRHRVGGPQRGRAHAASSLRAMATAS